MSKWYCYSVSVFRRIIYGKGNGDMQLNNFIGGSWQESGGANYTAVTNPANGEELAQVRLSTK